MSPEQPAAGLSGDAADAPPVLPPVLSPAELAEHLSLPENWVGRHAAKWPHHRFGRHIRFTGDDIAAILELHAVRPAAPPLTVHEGQLITLEAMRPIGGRRRRPR